ncbi:hypothetical protein HAX54_013223 [Datura stramonium]|uniref:Uncharacterized protein n=1 Tax=Datura stramonium TaxID=4076 RepID=A0ABS8TNS8_DATST|nr:hypothetical protein [Datura stramonium]
MATRPIALSLALALNSHFDLRPLGIHQGKRVSEFARVGLDCHPELDISPRGYTELFAQFRRLRKCVDIGEPRVGEERARRMDFVYKIAGDSMETMNWRARGAMGNGGDGGDGRPRRWKRRRDERPYLIYFYCAQNELNGRSFNKANSKTNFCYNFKYK